VVVRAAATFAKPEIYEALEDSGMHDAIHMWPQLRQHQTKDRHRFRFLLWLQEDRFRSKQSDLIGAQPDVSGWRDLSPLMQLIGIRSN